MEFDKKQILSSPYKVVSLTGVQEIHNYLMVELDRLTHLYFPISWSWEWMITQDRYRGKLPNRLAQLVRTCHGIRLTSEQKSAIGNIARKHLLAEENYTIDFTDKFDWEAGDFGDHGSCFWKANFGAREVMEEEDVLAIRFYDEDGHGTGRAWLYELSIDAWVLFNAYGLECVDVAAVFAMRLGEDTGDTWQYERLDSLEIAGAAHGFVYINNSPQIIYRKDYDRELNVNLDWDIPYAMCSSCGDWVHYDNTFYDEEFGEPYCYECYEALLAEKEEERLAELEERLEQEMEEDFRDDACRAEIAHTMAQEAIRNSITAQLVAGQLCLGAEYQVNLFYG